MKKRIAILSGGGDVPGLNAAIKSFVWRMDDEHEIIGLRRGWASLLSIVPEPDADNSSWILPLNRLNTRVIDRSGGAMNEQRFSSPQLEHVINALQRRQATDRQNSSLG